MTQTKPHPLEPLAAGASPAARPRRGAGASRFAGLPNALRPRRMRGGAPSPGPAVPTALADAVGFDWRRSLSLLRRMLAGDLRVLRDVADRVDDLRQLIPIVLLGSFAAALGAWLWLAVDAPQVDLGAAALRVLLFGSIAAAAGWALWTGATWWALRRIFGVRIDFARLARPLALCAGFGLWQVFLLAGPLSFAIGLVITFAWLVLAAVAVRAASGVDDREAIISVGVGFAVYALPMSLLAGLAGIAPGIFVHAADLAALS